MEVRRNGGTAAGAAAGCLRWVGGDGIIAAVDRTAVEGLVQFGWIGVAAVAVATVAAGVPAHGPESTAVRPAGSVRNLARFEALMGGRWVAEGELPGGRRYTAERRYDWLLDRRFVRLHQRLTVDAVTVDEEVTFGWDPAEGVLRMWSVASDGSFAEGTERPAEGENRWVFEGRTVGGRTGEWRTTTLIIDRGSFSVLLEVRNDAGAYEPAMTLAYRKIADAPPSADTSAVPIDTMAVGADTSAMLDILRVLRSTVPLAIHR